MLGVRREFVRARRTLITVLRHLAVYREDAIVVAGAQAVYIRTAAEAFPFTPFTFDSDIVLDPRVLDPEPPVGSILASLGYVHRAEQPGLYWAPGSDRTDGCQVDLLVPERFAAGRSRRDANLPGANRRAARRTRGLEATLYDRERRRIDDLEDPTISAEALVAGPAALIVAKAQKIAERSSTAPDRVKVKDVTDVFGLLRAHEPEDLRARFSKLARVDAIREPFLGDLAAIRDVFGGQRGRMLFADAIREMPGRDELFAAYLALTGELLGVLPAFEGLR
jgi:hypothetical protein